MNDRIRLKYDEAHRWYDLWFGAKLLGYLYINSDGEVMMHIYKNRVGSISVG